MVPALSAWGLGTEPGDGERGPGSQVQLCTVSFCWSWEQGPVLLLLTVASSYSRAASAVQGSQGMVSRARIGMSGT